MGKIKDFASRLWKSIRHSLTLATLAEVKFAEVVATINQLTTKSCQLDTLPTWLLKDCIDDMTPMLPSMVNASIYRSNVHRLLK